MDIVACARSRIRPVTRLSRTLPWLLPYLAAVSVSDASAQVVIGRVLEDPGSAPVSGAQVVIAGPDGRVTLLTDSAGAFATHLPTGGIYGLMVTHPSYHAYSTDFLQVPEDGIAELFVRLGVDAVPLEPLVVSVPGDRQDDLVGFRERMHRRTGGVFLTRNDIEKHPATRVTELFSGVPQVGVAHTRRGPATIETLTLGSPPCIAPVFLDGIPFRQGTDLPLDDLLLPSSVEAIEVYSALTVPPRYATPEGCGAILFWSRVARGTRSPSWRPLLTIGALWWLISTIAGR